MDGKATNNKLLIYIVVTFTENKIPNEGTFARFDIPYEMILFDNISLQLKELIRQANDTINFSTSFSFYRKFARSLFADPSVSRIHKSLN